MTEHETLEALVPGFEDGTLAPADRARLERHLTDCRDCRELLELARMQREILGRRGADVLLAHVDPVLLTEYSERPESLEPETRRWIEEKLRECRACGEAYARLVEVRSPREVEPAPVPTTSRILPWIWERLAATILRPAPALAYLALLALLGPFLLVRERGDDAPIASGPVLVVPGETGTRDGGDGAEIPPLGVPATTDPGQAVVLLLETEIVETDLRDGRMGLALELRQGDRVVASRAVSIRDFEFRDGHGLLPLVVRAGALRPGDSYEVSVRAVRPGDPLDGEPLFRRRLRVEGGRGK